MTRRVYTTPDQLEKALELFISGRLISIGEGLWLCQSSCGPARYTVTASTCTCPDFLNRHRVCKHMLAAHAIKVVLALREMRRAESVDGLREIAERYADAIRAAEFRFRKVASDEYKALRGRLLQAALVSSPLAPCKKTPREKAKESKREKETGKAEKNQGGEETKEQRRMPEGERKRGKRRKEREEGNERGLGRTHLSICTSIYIDSKNMVRPGFFVNDPDLACIAGASDGAHRVH